MEKYLFTSNVRRHFLQFSFPFHFPREFFSLPNPNLPFFSSNALKTPTSFFCVVANGGEWEFFFQQRGDLCHTNYFFFAMRLIIST
jgi:hypothetical protein